MRIKRVAAVAAVGRARVRRDRLWRRRRRQRLRQPVGRAPAASIGKAEQRPEDASIGIKFDQPGLGLQTGSKHEGFDVEIAQDHRQGPRHRRRASIECVDDLSANREPFIQQGKVDLVVATYTINDERKEKVTFAGPYYVAGQDLLVPGRHHHHRPGVARTARRSARSPAPPRPSGSRRVPEGRHSCSCSTPTPSASTPLNGGQVDAVTTDDIILAGYAAQSQTPASSRWSASRSPRSRTASA